MFLKSANSLHYIEYFIETYTNIKNCPRYLPPHWLPIHGCVDVDGPKHAPAAPPIQVRARVCCPEPHWLEQVDHAPHAPQATT